MTDPSQSKTVAVIGGGLAGLAAGCALADAGLRVTVFERRPYVGGRASSYEHPGTGEVVDNCQHVLLGCCTNLVQFYERLGVTGKIRWFNELVFMEPGGKSSKIKSSFLPAPFHSMPSFLMASVLSLRDKLAIARAFAVMARGPLPDDSPENFQTWLLRHGQTQRAIEHFWKVVLVSALNEDLDRISVRYAFQVFRESFLKSAAAGRMGIPSVPLSDLYSSAIEYIRTRGGDVLLRASVTAVNQRQQRVAITTSAGEQEFDFAVLAAPFQNAAALLPVDALAEPLKKELSQSICGLTVRSRRFRTRCCSTAPFNGCSRNPNSWKQRNATPREATWNWWSAHRNHWSRNRAKKFSSWHSANWRNSFQLSKKRRAQASDL